MTQLRNHSIVRKASSSSAAIADDWRDQSACRDADPETFFAHPSDTAGIVEALDHCAVCPVREQCLQWAVDNHMHEGVWGGQTEQQRHQQRLNGGIECGTERGYRSHKSRKTTVCEPCQAVWDAKVEADRRDRLAEEHAKGGSMTGLGIHLTLGEQPCQLCLDANRLTCQQRRREARERLTQPGTACGDSTGSMRGYRRHERANDVICEPCKKARAEARKAARDARKTREQVAA